LSNREKNNEAKKKGMDFLIHQSPNSSKSLEHRDGQAGFVIKEQKERDRKRVRRALILHGKGSSITEWGKRAEKGNLSNGQKDEHRLKTKRKKGKIIWSKKSKDDFIVMHNP